ncbi:MAG: YihY/virulence factor BrkB family protein [Ruminococcaceae bacterium]|nr:YihY/virulence factor BrkB family protein [Oscillospiraceae bacterium]
MNFKWLEKVKNIALVRRVAPVVQRFLKDDITGLAAELTFYLITAFFPFLILIFTIISYSPLTAETTLLPLLSALPAQTYHIIVTVLTGVTRSIPIICFSTLVALWSMSGAINAIAKALNRFYRVTENRSIFRLRMVGMLFAFAIAVSIVLSFVLLVLGSLISDLLSHYFHNIEAIWPGIRVIFVALMLSFTFALLYRMMPNRRLQLRQVLGGAFFASLAWGGSSLLFSFYVNNFARYHIIYGSLGGVVALITWLYMTSYIILLGGAINALLAERKDDKSV